MGLCPSIGVSITSNNSPRLFLILFLKWSKWSDPSSSSIEVNNNNKVDKCRGPILVQLKYCQHQELQPDVRLLLTLVDAITASN